MPASIVLAEAHDGNTDQWDLQGVPLGPEAPDRIVIAGISTGNANVTEMTINAVAATRVVESEPFANRHITSWWVATVPDGEEVEILWSQNNVSSWAAAVIAVGYGLDPEPLDTAEDHDDGYPNTGTASLDLSLDTAAGGFVIALAGASVVGSPSTSAWAGLTAGATITHVGQATHAVPASLAPSSDEAPRAIGFDLGGSGAEVYSLGAAAVSFAPAETAITGTLGAAESGSDAAAASGGVLVSGGLTAQEAGVDTAAISGDVAGAVSGTLAAQEFAADAAVFDGLALVAGSLAAQEGARDTFSGGSAVVVPRRRTHAGLRPASLSTARRSASLSTARRNPHRRPFV